MDAKAFHRYLATGVYVPTMDAAPLTDLEKHDRRFHPHGFDPRKDRCLFRERMAKGDDTDAALAEAEVAEGGSRPDSPSYYTRDAILARTPELAEDYDAMAKLGNRTDKDGVTHPTRIWSATGRPVSKELDDFITACMAGVDVPDELIRQTPEWKEAQARMERTAQPFADVRNHKGKIDTSLLPDFDVAKNGETRGAIRKRIWDTMLADTVTADINDALKIDKKTGKPKHPPYQVERGKRIDLVIGRPSAGKSSAFVNDLSVTHKARVCDSDTIKKMLPEFDGGYGAGVVHEESSLINDRIIDIARDRGENIVYPLLGKKVDKMEKLIDDCKKAGYSVHLHFNHLPGSKAKGRMLKRWLETNRFLDLGNISGAEGIDKVYKAVKGKCDSAEAKTNDVPFGEKPKLFEP